jgi:hypothetical protein
MKKENSWSISAVSYFGYFVFLAIALGVANAMLADAALYNITYSCEDGVCVEGKPVNWNITIYNRGDKVIEYTTIELFDSVSNNLIAEVRVQFNPLSSDRGSLIVVNTNSKKTIMLSGNVPKANYRQSLIYYPCLTKTVTDSYLISKYGKYEKRHCYTKNETMPVVECLGDGNCGNDERCVLNKCAKVECGECQYITNHMCVDYECCSAEQCGYDEICINNSCQKLDCGEDEYIENRTCKALNCGYDEYIENRTCKALNCGYDEYIFNHTCKKLVCKENEFIEEHKCKLLKCKENEYAENHTCKKLSCLYNETVSQHKCVPLECRFFQKIKNHECVADKSLILKSLAELVALVIIIALLFLDTKKYKITHKKDGTKNAKSL